MKPYTPGNPKMYLCSVPLSIRLTVKCLYYEICESAIHDSLVQPHTCSLASTLLRLKTPTIEKWAAKVGMFALSRPFLSMPLTWRTKIPQYVKRWPQGCDSKSLSVVLIIRLWANMGEIYCRPIYSVAVIHQLSVTDRIPQNFLKVTTNILDFPKCTSVCLHHLIKTVPEMYV